MFSTHRLLILLMACWLITSTSLGQRPRPGRRPNQRPAQRPAPPTTPLKTSATLKGVSAGTLLVTTAKGDDWLVRIPRQIENLVYEATASTDWLQRGMTVRFDTVLDKKLRAQEGVRELTVVTIREGIEPGIYPEANLPDKDELFNGDNENKKRKKIRKPARQRIPCLVIGRLLGLKKGAMSVAAGRNVVQVPLAENAKVSVTINDYRLAQPGDQVEINARYYEGAPGRAQGERLIITAAKPLVKAIRTVQRRHRARKAKKTAATPPEVGQKQGP